MTATTNRVPELSLKSFLDGAEGEKRNFRDALFAGLKNYGFVILKDHSVDLKLIHKSYGFSKELFALSDSAKTQYAKEGGGQRGYFAFGKERSVGSQFPDLKEFWHIGRELPENHAFNEHYPKNIWPNHLLGFRENFLELFGALDNIASVLLRALAPSLELAEDYFEPMLTDGNNVLRLLHYPPIAENANPNCIRAAAHEDINLITILVAASCSGLELLDRNGDWLPVETEMNNLIVDAGDMMSRITNGVIPATTHRVINPNDGLNESRYSMPYFIHPNPSTTLTCLPSCVGDGVKYPDINAQMLLEERLRANGVK